ncbi:MAG TPA: methylated-DNA--[protein]-cysteine S-methyltransferase [Tepidisphaeraceae bacterium]|jgi:methylated-DNA-[protein]-cysteine S-methyltransferase|nr:methylated-DNA--[protein]-cysteine S-methyltransferase [Tepidisphaeraceae bacterium]
MHLRLERWASPVSPLLLVTDGDGVLRALDFAECEPRMRRLLRDHYGDVAITEGKSPRPLTESLEAYFAGDLDALGSLETATSGTPFRRQVWQALRAIPAGTTQSYGQLAARIGRPTASRAVGSANGANPIAIVVPCHRVIGANGTLTGYAGGLHHKTWLLRHETQYASLTAARSPASALEPTRGCD